MYPAVCLLLAAAILAWIVRYRVHIHIAYEPPTPRRRRRSARRRQVEPDAGHYDGETVATLTDALVSLGATRTAARAAARKALAELPAGTTDELLRAAIQQATTRGVS